MSYPLPIAHAGGHFKRVCRICLEQGRQTILAQCRCPSSDKATTFGLCKEHDPNGRVHADGE